MPVWPKSFHSFALSLRTAATEWALRKTKSAAALQEKTLAGLTPRLAATTYWKAAGIEAGMAYAAFQNRVPLHTVEQLEPAIADMQRGESDVLWPGRCALFAATAGTTTGEPRLVPCTEELIGQVQDAGLAALLYYTVRVRHAAVFRGRHLMLGGSTALQAIEGAAPETYAGDLSGIAALSLPAWAERHLYEPGARLAQMAAWDEQMAAIAARTVSLDISLLAGLPGWTLRFAEAVKRLCATSNQPIADLQGRWPNLECYVHTGASVLPYQGELRELLGAEVVFHDVYAASEGVFAVQDAEAGAGLRVLADAGIFFEFLPVAELEGKRLDHLGPRAVPLAAVKTGVDYAVVLTTPAGLARTLLGDIVRFTSTEPPRLIRIGRTTLRLDYFGERVYDRELAEALATVCARRDWKPVNYHVAPLPGAPSLTGEKRGRHEWWLELKPGTVATPTGPQIAVLLDAELVRLNESYAARRKSGVIEAPYVRLVMPGVMEHWQRYRQQWGGQHKMPACRGDRAIADELAQITNFARD